MCRFRIYSSKMNMYEAVQIDAGTHSQSVSFQFTINVNQFIIPFISKCDLFAPFSTAQWTLDSSVYNGSEHRTIKSNERIMVKWHTYRCTMRNANLKVEPKSFDDASLLCEQIIVLNGENWNDCIFVPCSEQLERIGQRIFRRFARTAIQPH